MTKNNSTRFVDTLRAALWGYGAQRFVEFEGAWVDGSAMTGYIARVRGLLKRAGVPDGTAIGVVVRNRPVHAAAILGFIVEQRSFSILYSLQSVTSLAKDVEGLRLSAVVAAPEDWSPEVVEAARRTGTAGISIAPDCIDYVDQLGSCGEGPFGAAPEYPSIGVLTSGTTGAPKRVHIELAKLEQAAASFKDSQKGAASHPDLVSWPFSGIGGICQLVGTVYAKRRMIMLEKFTVPAWVDAVRRHRIERVGAVPATIRMLLDAKVPRQDLASLKAIMGGSAPLEPETRELFEQTYGIPIVWGYGATEFVGTIITWTPELYERYGRERRESAGRPVSGVEVRVVDPDTGSVLPSGEQGLLEAQVALLGRNWIRTTDLASVDDDGFVTIHGRQDGAINRGGFKILPEAVERVLLEHPAVRDVAVVGAPENRLGEVPVAVVELAGGTELPEDNELKDWVRERLPAHHVPVQIRLVPHLPRNAALKVDRRAVRELVLD